MVVQPVRRDWAFIGLLRRRSKMDGSLGRDGRRRRVLNEEMVAASATQAAVRISKDLTTNKTPRPTYGEAASSSNHVRVSDFVPRRASTLWFAWILGLLAVSGLVALDYYQDALRPWLGEAPASSTALLSTSGAGSIGSWFASVVLLLTAAHAAFIYSTRRHRLDDYRGKYRVWLWAALACFLLSINSVTGLHAVLAATAARLVGWTALPGHAIWWLAPGLVTFGWIAMRVLRDVWESWLARLVYLTTLVIFCLGAAQSFYGLPGLTDIDPGVTRLIAPAAVLLAWFSLLTAVSAYARFVILDADGLVPVPEGSKSTDAEAVARAPAKRKKVTTQSRASAPAKVTTPAATSKVAECTRRPGTPAQKRSSTAKPIEWNDGSLPDSDYKDNDSQPHRRKLSKSERKRLRKQKAQQRRAA